MSSTLDEEIVATWCEPVSLAELMRMVREAGFSGDTYRETYADLAALLATDTAGTLHFLRHGFFEGRVFRNQCNLAGLAKLHASRMHNHAYRQNLVAALAGAWAGSHVRTAADLATHAATIAQLTGLGGVPYILVGDGSADLYRRSVCAGEKWLCPLPLSPIEGGIEALTGRPMTQLASAFLDAVPAVTRTGLPVVWKFGQADIQTGYLAHRLRHAIGPGDESAFDKFATSLVESYAQLLARAVPAADRPRHWIAASLPPVWQVTEREQPALGLLAEFPDAREMISAAGLDNLLDRTAMHRLFNARLRDAVAALGFPSLCDFDSFLSGQGVIDDHYLVQMKDRPDMDYQASRGILSTSLWNIAERMPPPVEEASSITAQFEQLLEEIRRVQLGEVA